MCIRDRPILLLLSTLGPNEHSFFTRSPQNLIFKHSFRLCTHLKSFKVALHHIPQSQGFRAICVYSSNETLYKKTLPGFHGYLSERHERYFLENAPLAYAVLVFRYCQDNF